MSLLQGLIQLFPFLPLSHFFVELLADDATSLLKTVEAHKNSTQDEKRIFDLGRFLKAVKGGEPDPDGENRGHQRVVLTQSNHADAHKNHLNKESEIGGHGHKVTGRSP